MMQSGKAKMRSSIRSRKRRERAFGASPCDGGGEVASEPPRRTGRPPVSRTGTPVTESRASARAGIQVVTRTFVRPEQPKLPGAFFFVRRRRGAQRRQFSNLLWNKEKTDERITESVRAAAGREPHLPDVDGARLLPRGAGSGQEAVFHRHAAAERHRPAAHGARDGRDPAGYPDALQAYAGVQRAVAPRHRPRGHRHADQGRGGAAHQGGADTLRPRAREVFAARVAVEGKVRQPHRRAAEEDGRELRLVTLPLHDGRGLLPRRARDVLRAVRQGADLQGQPHHQLVPALPDRALRRGGGVC